MDESGSKAASQRAEVRRGWANDGQAAGREESEDWGCRSENKRKRRSVAEAFFRRQLARKLSVFPSSAASCLATLAEAVCWATSRLATFSPSAMCKRDGLSVNRISTWPSIEASNRCQHPGEKKNNQVENSEPHLGSSPATCLILQTASRPYVDRFIAWAAPFCLSALLLAAILPSEFRSVTAGLL